MYLDQVTANYANTVFHLQKVVDAANGIQEVIEGLDVTETDPTIQRQNLKAVHDAETRLVQAMTRDLLNTIHWAVNSSAGQIAWLDHRIKQEIRETEKLAEEYQASLATLAKVKQNIETLRSRSVCGQSC